MYIVSEILGVISEYFIFYLFLHGIFPKRHQNWLVCVGVNSVLGGILLSLSFWVAASELRLFYCLLSMVLLARIFSAASWMQSVYCSISFGCILVLTDVFSITLGSIAGIKIESVMSQGLTRAYFILFTHTIMFVLVLLVLSLTKHKRSAVTAPFLLAILPGSISGIVMGIYYVRTAQELGSHEPITILIVSAGLLYLNILLVFYAERVQEASQLQHQADLAKQHFAMQEQYYAQLRDDQKETRAMFHDISKYLQAMQALVDESNTAQANDMLRQVQQLYQGIGNVVEVGNSMVSILLNEYLEKAKKQNTRMDFDISVSETLGITAIDLYVILGNLLDNALEACAFLPEAERFIHIQMRSHHDILFCQIENSLSPQYPYKRKGKNHGFGLDNVRRCVEKHQGDIRIEQEANSFRVSLRLNTPS